MNIHSYYFKVIPELRDYVDFVLFFEGEKVFFPDRLIPSPYTHLLVNSGNPFEIFPNNDKKNPVSIRDGWLKSLHEKPYGIRLGEYTRIVSIRFKPCAAYSLTLRSMIDLSNKIIQAEELENICFPELLREFRNASSPEKIEKMVNDYLLARLKPEAFDQPRVYKALELMKNKKSNVRVPELAKIASVSTKHLKFLFDKYIGLSPKKYGCLLRFNALAPLIANEEYSDWMTVVEKFGYYDQPHFNRDFKKFTGLTPTEFVKDFHLIDNNVFRKSDYFQFIKHVRGNSQ